MGSSKVLDVFLFKFFVFTLSLGHFIQLPFGDFYSKIVPQFSTSVMFIGFILLLPNLKKVINHEVQPFVNFWFFSVLYTIFACSLLIILYYSGFAEKIDLQAWSLETPYRAAMRDMVFWGCCLMALLYSYYNLRYVVSFSELRGTIEFSIIVILFVGLLQYGMLNGNGVCTIIYTALSSIFQLVNLSNIQIMERGVCFWGTEPASASALCMFILPFSIITFITSKGGGKVRFGIYAFLFLFLLLNSGSSSTIITCILVILCTILYVLKGTIKKWVYIMTFSFGFVVVLLYTLDINIKTQTDSVETSSFEYIILGKLVDRENGSTANRVSTVCNDMKIFASYPITGVGNGCQGYFYKNNIPEWTKFAGEVKSAMYYEAGSIANGGGNFFASYISGYGLIGVVVLIMLLRKYRLNLSNSIVNYDTVAGFSFSVCIIVFLLGGWYVQTIEDNKLMFMLALGCVPYVGFLKNNL